MEKSQLHGLSADQILSTHHYQYDGSHRNPNECTLCSMTTLLDLAAKYSEKDLGLEAVDLGHSLDRIPFRHPRFPAWFPGPGGATHPRAALKGLEAAIRKLRKKGIPFPWWPIMLKKQSPSDIEAALDAGHPSLIYGVGRTGIPHVVVPVARKEKGWLVLDPGYPSARNPKQWTDAQLVKWWQAYSVFYPAGTMISLRPDGID
jgi:hypothetical protein